MMFGFFPSLFNDVLHDIINRVTNNKRNINVMLFFIFFNYYLKQVF
jgi:hypothetical protein